ncbi:(2Fe-2S)-binding protein [Prosthecobacter vanneervenii]|uniref:Isoquinoline 1-oxidoreductase alpha subunit n=1 Tax=Prosthecobacter vanneervenii TaxID=48466 RepID=A0A7W7YGA0_9BACT|nr:(2Fe-2S)-binding protein [Prosthecobacter vanneervenii]MBB5035663.1 isoquinoline 1-oxidoreductase alpha subunit [Prosthecobacter vanneervenii]
MITLNINGKAVQVDVAPSTPLLWVLRDVVGLTGTKYGCGVEICGACTVWIDGSAEKSCDVAVKEVVGKKITTIEGLSPDGASHPVQKAWVACQVPQCGYCQSGMIMKAAAMLRENKKPTDAQIDGAMNNLCVCGTYQRIRDAIKLAATL